MAIKNIKKDEKSTEANTTLKDKLKNIKNKKSSSFTEDDIPTRLQKTETTIDKIKMAKGGRVNLRGGGICKKGMNKKAIGRNS